MALRAQGCHIPPQGGQADRQHGRQVVVPGDSESSTFFRLVGHKADPKIQMPPHHSDTVASKQMKPLPDKQIELIKTWIDQGAKNN